LLSSGSFGRTQLCLLFSHRNAGIADCTADYRVRQNGLSVTGITSRL
jgi:hypothetical protein